MTALTEDMLARMARLDALKGFADHGSEAAAAIVHDMGAQIVRALASGEWRKDLPT